MEAQYLVVHKVMMQGEEPAKVLFTDKKKLSEYLSASSSPKEINRDYDIYKLTLIKANFIPSRFEFSDDETSTETKYMGAAGGDKQLTSTLSHVIIPNQKKKRIKGENSHNEHNTTCRYR